MVLVASESVPQTPTTMPQSSSSSPLPTQPSQQVTHEHSPPTAIPTSSSSSDSPPHHPRSEQRHPAGHSTATSLPEEAAIDNPSREQIISHHSSRDRGRPDRQDCSLSLSRVCRRMREICLGNKSSPIPSSVPSSSSSSLPSSSDSLTLIASSLPSPPPSSSSHTTSSPTTVDPSSSRLPHRSTQAPPPTINSYHSHSQLEYHEYPGPLPAQSSAHRIQSSNQTLNFRYLELLSRNLRSLRIRNHEPAQILKTVAWPVESFHSAFGQVTGTVPAGYSSPRENNELQISQRSKMADKKAVGNYGVGNENIGRQESVPHLQYESLQDVEMADWSITSTPAQAELSTPSSATSTRRLTRSMTRVHFADPLEATTSHTSTSVRDKLRRSAKKAVSTLGHSDLEQSRDIGYGDEEQDNELEADDHDDADADIEMKDQDLPLVSPPLERAIRKYPAPRRAPTRRSTRSSDCRDAVKEPVDVAALAESKKRVQKTKKPQTGLGGGRLRRSSRLSKPLTEFHKFSDLPVELQMLVWEAAIEPRLVYICNRSSATHAGAPFGIQSKPFTWFAACKVSLWIAKLHYSRMFALNSPYIPVDLTISPVISPTTIQHVKPSIDIVVFEPCHSACRGCHCARHQYCDADRSAVRFLAIQTDSPNLPAASEPCWETVPRSWPNVETLYLMREAVKGVDRREKAMIRVQNNEHEIELQKQFEEWKKGLGMYTKVNKIEFVVVVEKEGTATLPKDRYKTIDGRLTGLPEDIIIG
ncbi:hypothetical protein F5Y04DRAFT_167713 [Hypomontagnella monticulosa]|nr:hypothetical protein F5Y04DRAFT_167713 [Hypomontagnella monticulosa]